LKLDGQGNIIWQKSVGGNYGNGAIKGIEIDGKGFLLGCSTTSGISGNKTVGFFGGIADCWLVRLNETGDILWQKELGGSAYEQGYQIQTTPDGSILLAGTTDSSDSGNIDQTSNGSNDYWLLKLNPEELATSTNLSASLSLWPNPTANVVNIRFPDFQEKVAVSVYDALGRLVSDGKYENVSVINGLALGNAAGLYLVKVETAKGVESFKILKN